MFLYLLLNNLFDTKFLIPFINTKLGTKISFTKINLFL